RFRDDPPWKRPKESCKETDSRRFAETERTFSRSHRIYRCRDVNGLAGPVCTLLAVGSHGVDPLSDRMDCIDARCLPTGHLAYVRQETLSAIPFDPIRGLTTGTPVPLLEGVMQAQGISSSGIRVSGATEFAVSRWAENAVRLPSGLQTKPTSN